MDNTSARNGVSAIVEYDYTAKEPDELTLSKGATIHNIKVQPGGWWEGTLESTGKSGMFPDNFVKVLEPDTKNPVILREKSATASRRCKAVYSYTQNNNDELTLAVGDLIEFLGEVEEGWWRGKLGDKMGVFPSNFVIMEAQSPALAADRRSAAAMVAAASVKTAASSAGTFSHTPNGTAAAAVAFAAAAVAKQMSSSREDLVSSSTGDAPADAPILPPKPVRELCKVLYPYSPANDDELELREGEIIAILSRELPDKGWLKGELKGKIGVFPDNFVVLISSEASPTKETAAVANHKPDRPPSTTKMSINSKITASSTSNTTTSTSSSSSTVITATNNHTTTRESFGSRDSLNDTPAAVIPSGNVAAYRKSLEKQVLDITSGPAAVAAAAAAAAIEKPARKSFDTKTSDFRKSIENLDEKSKGGAPPPVLTKKPSVPVKKSPTVSSVAGSIFSGIKSKVVSNTSKSTSSTSIESSKSASSDSLDGIGSSRVAYNVSENVIGERIRRDNSADFDQVERGQSILQDMRAGRAKAPKRRPPTSAISTAGSSTESGGDSSGTYVNNGVNDEGTNDDRNEADHDSKSKPAAAGDKPRNWEKQKAPWMEELRANQASKKTSPNAPSDFGGKSLDHDTTTVVGGAVTTSSEKTSSTSFDMSKSYSSSYVTSSSTSSQAVRKSSEFNTADVQLRNAVASSETTTTNNIMARSMSGLSTSKITFNPNSSTTIEPIGETKKPRPTSVNLRNRSISPIGRMSAQSVHVASPPITSANPTGNAIDTAAKHVNNFAIADLPPSGAAAPVAASSVTIENVCPRVQELEQKVSRLERLVQQQAQTHEELLRAFRDETEKVKALRGELDKYAQCVTQV